MNKDCPNCSGTGVVTIADPDGDYEYTILCPACDGTGKVDEDE